MSDIPIGWATLLAASVTAIASLAAVIVTIILSARTRRDVKQVKADARSASRDASEVKEQVKNSHSTNLREEQDTRHTELVSELKAIRGTQSLHGRQIAEVQRKQRGMQRDIGRLADADQEQTRSDHRLGERITELERTQPGHAHPPTQGDNP